MIDIAKTEIMGCVTIRIFYKHDNQFNYYVDVVSTNKHQKSWNRKLFSTIDPPDGETMSYCFFIHTKVIKHIQKTLKKKTSNLLKKTQYKRLYDAQEGRCYLCDREMSIYDTTIDHVWPISLGGKDKMSNKLLAHGQCNAEKSNREPTKNELALMEDIHRKAQSITYYKIIK